MSDKTSIQQAHAVVLGAGMAGLLAARVLAEHFGAVTVVECDRLPGEPRSRPGVPQSAHVHGLLAGGMRALERLLPGIGDDLRELGGVSVDMATDFVMATPFGWAPRFASDLHSISASRSLLDWAVYQRVRTLPTVTFCEQQRVDSLRGEPSRITGVAMHDTVSKQRSTLAADFVVDATGRGSQVDRWLTALGCLSPPQTLVKPHMAYATRIYRIPGDPPPWRLCYLMTLAPRTRGGAIISIEHDRWMVSLVGVGKDQPTNSDEDFLPFARSLHSSVIADALAGATPLTSATSARSTSSRRRRMHRKPGQPGNLVLLGDSACCLNPVYGQGMSAAALSAEILRDCLDRQDVLDGLARTYHRKVAKLHDTCWLLSTTADSRHPTTEGPVHTAGRRILGSYLDRAITAGTRNAQIHNMFLQVLNLTSPPAALLAPRLLPRILSTAPAPARQLPAQPAPPVLAPAVSSSHVSTR